jgi:peroxiredoxin
LEIARLGCEFLGQNDDVFHLGDEHVNNLRRVWECALIRQAFYALHPSSPGGLPMKPDWSHWLVVVGVLLYVSGAGADDAQPKDAAADERLHQVIEQVRLAEERYRNLETVVRITSQDEVNPTDLNDRKNVSKSDETSYLLQQGDLFLFKWREVQSFGAGEPTVTEQVAAFDGETTRCVIFGNCANVFAGRHEPPRLYPPHTWCLRTLWVNYPLSVYLQGTEAIKKHPKSFKSPVERGRVFEIAKVEVTYEGDEELDGLKCVKLQARHWNREKVTPQITEAPKVVQLWLARERAYLCAKVDITVGEGFQGTMRNETKVTEWTEIQPGLWLPKQIQTAHYVVPRNGGDEVVRRREALVLEKASANVKVSPERFAEVKPPKGLPTYKIDRDGLLEDSAVKSAKAPAGDPRELDRLIAELKRQEERYQQYDISTTATYRALEGRKLGPGFITSIDEAERTISLPGKLYCDHIQKSRGTAGFLGTSAPGAGSASGAASDTVSRTEASWDGEWIRSFEWYADKSELPAEPRSIGLQKGGPKGLAAFRPHTAVFSDHRMRAQALSDFLTAEYWDDINKYRFLVEYVSEETVNGLRCAKLRLGSLFGDEKEPKHQFLFVWLARDRNYLAVRSQWVELGRSDLIPTGVAYVDDLREVVPGLWFPYHVVETACDTIGFDGTGSGQVLINWRRERQVESLNLEPDVPEELFTPAASSGTWVYVSNESGQHVGRFRHRGNGAPTVGEDKYQVMAEIAGVDWRDAEDRKQRQAALDALVGTPRPDFGKGTWINGPPLDDESLAGKVVLIEFCAKWWQPCHDDLEKLGKADRDLAADGVTIIAVHTAGSDKQDIEDLANDLDLNFPIYVDAPAPGGKSRWGRLFEKLAVRELPHTFVVDRDGKIAAHGGLDQMIRQAQSLADKK